MSNELHPIQIQILNKLLFADKLRYSQLRPDTKIENNSLNFHINRLLELNLITRSVGNYQLTVKGKEYAGRINTDTLVVTKQAKISAWVVCTRQGTEEQEYLIATRCKHPFYGCQGFISGKVAYGEQVIATAQRELLEETGLRGAPKLVMIKHYRVFRKEKTEIFNEIIPKESEQDNLLEDKFMFMYVVENPTGEMVPDNESSLEWIPESKLTHLIIKPYESIEKFHQQISEINNFTGQIKYIEEDYYSDLF